MTTTARVLNKTPDYNEVIEIYNAAVQTILSNWKLNTTMNNFKLPDGRTISLTNTAVGSKKLAVVVKMNPIQDHYSPTSEGSLLNILKCPYTTGKPKKRRKRKTGKVSRL
tara:strand:- start:205 stop:534 length:330 start_codon:yes stop_codon:yes gene_type:complete